MRFVDDIARATPDADITRHPNGVNTSPDNVSVDAGQSLPTQLHAYLARRARRSNGVRARLLARRPATAAAASRSPTSPPGTRNVNVSNATSTTASNKTSPRLGLARAQLRRDPIAAQATLVELQTQTAQVLAELRALVQGIHPPVLVDRGLFEAVESRLANIPIGVEIHADPALRGTRFTSEVEAAAYFFISEALTNAMKHAKASRLVVRLAASDDQLMAEVNDDGLGFLPAATHNATSGSGLTGLVRPHRGRRRSGRDRQPPGSRMSPHSDDPGPAAPARRGRGQLMATGRRVVLAEDNYLVREGTRRLLKK
jgi:hypothetical protein